MAIKLNRDEPRDKNYNSAWPVPSFPLYCAGPGEEWEWETMAVKRTSRHSVPQWPCINRGHRPGKQEGYIRVLIRRGRKVTRNAVAANVRPSDRASYGIITRKCADFNTHSLFVKLLKPRCTAFIQRRAGNNNHGGSSEKPEQIRGGTVTRQQHFSEFIHIPETSMEKEKEGGSRHTLIWPTARLIGVFPLPLWFLMST